MAKVQRIIKKPIVYLIIFTLIFWTIGVPVFVFNIPIARAAVSVNVNTDGLPNNYPDESIGLNSGFTPIVRLEIWSSAASAIASTTIEFSGNGFSTSTLRDLAAASSSGVVLIRDNNGNGHFDNASDMAVAMNQAPAWDTTGTTSVTLTDFAGNNSLADNATTTFFIVIQTSSIATNSTQIIAAIPQNGIITGEGNGPDAAFIANSYVVDLEGPSLVAVEKVNNYAVEAIFSEDIEFNAAQNENNYAFSDSINVTNVFMRGMNKVKVEADGEITIGSTTLTIYPGIIDIAGNQAATSTLTATSASAQIKISEMSAYYYNNSSDFVELYNPSNEAADISNWKIQYSGAGNGSTWMNVANIGASASIQPYSFYLLASSEFDAISSADADNALLSGYLSTIGGHIRLYDYPNNKEIDRIGWGTAVRPEGQAVQSHAAGESLERQAFGDSWANDMATGGADEFMGNGWDSNDNNFDFVVQASSSPQNSASASEQPDYSNFSGSGPMIDHMPIWFAETGQALNIFAQMGDPMMALDDISPELKYKIGDGNTTDEAAANYTAAFGSHQGNGYFKFTIPQATIDNSTPNGLYYYLKLSADNNTLYMSESWEADQSGDESQVAKHPFIVSCAALGTTHTISGAVDLNSTTTESGVLIFAEGTGYSTTTLLDGNFSIAVKSGGYDLVFIKDGYYEEWRRVDAFSNVNIGTVAMWEGSGGGATGDNINPYVMWTGPMNGDTNLPAEMSGFKVLIGFSKGIDSTTFSSSTAILSTDGSAPIAGYTVEYNPARENWMPTVGQDPNLGVITAPPGGLAIGTAYYLVMTGNIRDTAGNPLQGNRASGGHEISFTTGWDTSGVVYGEGANMPPFVMDVKPSGGALNVPKNTKISVYFSDTMDNASVVAAGNIKLYKVNIINNIEQTTVEGITAVLDITKKIAIITPDSSLAAWQKYRLAVSGAVKSAAGIYMGDPGQSQNSGSYEAYRSSFETSDSIDQEAPTILGSWPSDGNANIPINPGSFYIQFSENLDPSRINSNTVTLKRGTSLVTSQVKYDPWAKSVYLVPKVALVNNVNYTLTLTGSTTGITDMAGAPLAADHVVVFTTEAASDSNPPNIMFANGDDFGVAITFNEPMRSANVTDSLNWPNSVLNPDNWQIKWGDPGTVVSSGNHINLSNARFIYDAFDSTVIIENLGLDPTLTGGKDFYIYLATSSAKDLSGNLIASGSPNTYQLPIQNSTDTYGLLGPGDMIGPDMADMGMMMAGAFPMNSMASQQTMYFIDIPITSSIPIGGKITITFPIGFDVAGAKKDPYSPINNDINEWNSGTVKFSTTTESSGGASNDGVTVSTSTRAITVTTSNAPTQANDYLHFDLAGIINSSIPRDFNTAGYQPDIKTYDASGNLLETINTMPFFITAGGQISLTVNILGINGDDVDGANDEVSVFLGSWMTGPMNRDARVLADGSASTTFTNLSPGDYMLYTDPMYALDGSDYSGISMPEPIFLSTSTVKNITLTKEDGSGAVAVINVSITGSFGTDDIDVFAGSPNGFKVKTLFAAGTDPLTTLYLGDGEWMVGMGPAMPAGPMDGPPPMPDWMPPMPRYLSISGGGTQVTPSNTVNFSVQSADKEIVGYVKDGADNAIADAEVWAYQPMGIGMGSHTKTGTDGKFTLKVAMTGTYQVGSFKPGLPFAPERSIAVKTDTDSGAADSNATADIYRDGGSLVTAGSPFVIKIQKPAYTISGKVTDGTNAVAYAPVWAEDVDGWGHADTMTDASGNYVIYVDNGIWALNAYVPGYGEAATQLVAVSDADEIQNLAPNQNIAYIDISGTVSDGSPLAYTPIRAVQFTSGGIYTGKEFGGQTDSGGNYSINVPGNNYYRVDVWTPEYGEVGLDADEVAGSPANLTATTTNRTSRDITINAGALKTITLDFVNAGSGQEGFLHIEGVDLGGADPVPTGYNFFTRIDDLTATNTVQLGDGDYFFFLDVPGIGSYMPDPGDRGADDEIAVSADGSVGFTLIDLSSEAAVISGTIYDTTATSGSELADAWVWIGNPSNGYQSGTQAAADGTYSLTVPTGSGYKMGADKPGYMSEEPVDLNVTTDAIRNFTLNSYSWSISGKLYADANSNTSYDSGEEVPNGFVRAETIECGDSDTGNDSDCVKAHTPVDGSGYYELGVVNGTWKVYGMANSYDESYYGSTIAISGANASSKHIKLSADVNWSNASKKKPIIPASGGTLDDTATSGTKIKLTIPPNALGNSSASGNVNAQKTSAITQTNSSDPVAGSGVNVTATDNSGQAINNLNDYIDMEIVLYKSDVDTAIADETLTWSKLKNTKNAYWDSSLNDWVKLATTRAAYYKDNLNDTDWIMYSNAATGTVAFEAFINEIVAGTKIPADYKLVYKSKTNHLTIFAVIMPFIVAPAQGAPEDPDPEPDPPSGGGGSPISYCSSVEYGEWGECSEEFQNREVVSKLPSSCRLTGAQEADKKRECVIGEEATTEKIITAPGQDTSLSTIDVLYLAQGKFIMRGEIEEILQGLGITERNHSGERLSRGSLKDRLGIDIDGLEPVHQYALTNFITYGSPDTNIGWGERAGVLNSFMAAFTKVPFTADDWSDVIKIANGRWPSQRSEEAENKSYDHFRKIYLRDPDRDNPHDDAAVTVIAYGLRPGNRNMESEAAAIRIFKAIYGYHPAGATDWDIVRSIAYSGAAR